MREIKFRAWDEDSNKMFNIIRISFRDLEVNYTEEITNDNFLKFIDNIGMYKNFYEVIGNIYQNRGWVE